MRSPLNLINQLFSAFLALLTHSHNLQPFLLFQITPPPPFTEADFGRQKREAKHQKREAKHQKREAKHQKREAGLVAQQQKLDLERRELEMKHQTLETYQTQYDSAAMIPSGNCRKLSRNVHNTITQAEYDAKLAQIETGKRKLYQMKEVFTREYILKMEQLEVDRASIEEQSRRLVEDRAKMEAESLALKQEYEAQIQTLKDAAEIAEQGLSRLPGVDVYKFAVIQERKLVGEKAQSLWDIPNQQFLSTLEMIDACNKNSKHYGASKTQVDIEFRCEQLSKQIHIITRHYLDLLRFIFDTGDDNHINPHDPNVALTSNTILSYYWKSDTRSDKAPKFTPDLKVFFSSPCISNGDWVQFHGPGTILYQIDPGFKLTVGSLCDPDGKGSFTSIPSQDPASDPNNKFHGTTYTSDYQIKFKWGE